MYESYLKTTTIEQKKPSKSDITNPMIRSNKTADIDRDFEPSVGNVFITLYPSPPMFVGRKLLKKKPTHNIFCKYRKG
jgi:hypothetical protein